MSLTPRSHKRKVPPVLPQDPDEEELQPVPSLPASPAPAPAELVVEDASKEKQDDDGFSPEEEERLRIWDMFAEEYHDIVAELPLEYQRTFLLLSELEETQQSSTAALKSSLQSHIVALSNPTAPASPTASTSAPSYVEEDEGPSPFQRQTLSSIAKSARAAVRAGEDKVGLAVALYESVDRHIRRLDADLAKYEDSLVIGLRDGTLPSHDAPSLSLKSPPGPTTSRGAIALGERDAFGELEEPWKRRRGGGRGGMEEQEARRIKQEKRRHRKEQEERETRERPIVVDPNEPTYCYCDRVSFGEMIGCDNDDCPREWFHLECVGMQIPPVGKWYCEDCAKNFGVAPKKSRKNR